VTGDPRPRELRPGLWRWTAPHPDWRPGAAPGSPGDWECEVGSVLYEAADPAVFVDPLLSRARRALPRGTEPLPIRRAGETMFWLAEHRALVAGDQLLGRGRGTLTLCPESWLGYLPSKLTVPELAAALAPLLELPVELVLVSHGEPVLPNGRAALARALEEARASA
jgi:hypothetical protein